MIIQDFSSTDVVIFGMCIARPLMRAAVQVMAAQVQRLW
jgi:hypothetical protein